MMQTLPFVVAKSSAMQAVVEPEASKKKEVKGVPFTQVLSKQMPQEETKKVAAKVSDKLTKENLTEEPAEDAIDLASVADIVMSERASVVDSEAIVDAQSMASQITASTIKDVTDGKVILDVPQAKDNIIQSPIPLINVVSVLPTNSKKPDGLTVDISSGDVTLEAAVKSEVSDKHVQQKANAFIPSDQSKNDQFARGLVADSKAQSTAEVAVTKAVSGAASIETDASTMTTISLQPTAKLTGTPVQTGAGNSIHATPGKAGWNEAVSQKIVWMVGATEQSAKLTLNPPELGPLEVIINVNNEKADTTFISENPEVRKALEEGVSTLRQLMGQAGVELGQTNVNTNKQHQEFQQSSREQLRQQSTTNNKAQTEDQVNNKPIVLRESNGLVDIFA